MDQPIGVFDSGIGGLTVANAVLELLPNESILYYADTAHLPYGQKPLEIIRQYSFEITNKLLEQGCKSIVIACNTASAAALPYLRHHFPDTILVGMEPAVKPAAKATRSGVVGVLATAGTFQSERYAQLMQRYTGDVQVLQNPCTGLVEIIESGSINLPRTNLLLREIISPMLAAGADTFVLGCTHYPFIRHLLEQLVPDDAIIIDPAPAVTRQLARRLDTAQLLLTGSRKPFYRFHASGSNASLQRTLEQHWPATFSLF